MRWLEDHRVRLGGASVSLSALALALIVIVLGFVLASKVAERVRGKGPNLESAVPWTGG